MIKYLLKNNGMTLLELVVVLSIITTSIGLGISSIKKKENQIKKTLRQLIALNRQLHSYAKLKRNVYRLAIALDAENSTWWVEKKIKDEEAKQIQEQLKNTDPVPTFMLDPEFVQKPQKLPEGLSFASVEFRTGENKILSEGEAYIPYFPEGQFNQAIIKIKGQKQYWSLFVDRFRGEARIFSGEKTFEDLKQ